MMAPSHPFDILYAPIVKAHLKAIQPKYYSLIQESLESQLRFEPDRETKNRKPLKRPVTFGEQWEARFGPGNSYRVFYKVNRQDHQVETLVVGIKQGSCLYIGGQEYQI